MAITLNKAAWTAWASKQKLASPPDDAALVAALGRWEKIPLTDGEAQLKALKALDTELQRLKQSLTRDKKSLGKDWEPLQERVDHLRAAVRTEEKRTNEAMEALKAAAAEEEDAAPDVLTTKLVPLLRAVRNPDVELQALIATAGTEAAVLLSRRAISPARGKLLKERLAQPGGIKYIRGRCLFEKNALTFIVEGSPAQLARRVAAALLLQTGTKHKVRVRGEDPSQVDEDGEDADAAPALAPEGPKAPDPLALRFKERWAAIEPQVAALGGRRDEAASRIRAVLAFAAEKAEAGTYAAAVRALDTLESLLGSALPAEGKASPTARARPGLKDNLEMAERVGEPNPPGGSPVTESAPQTTPPTATGALADWQQHRARALSALKDLATRIAQARHPRSADAIREIQALVARLAPRPGSRASAVEIKSWLVTDPVVADLCDLRDGFAKNVRDPMVASLEALERELA